MLGLQALHLKNKTLFLAEKNNFSQRVFFFCIEKHIKNNIYINIAVNSYHLSFFIHFNRIMNQCYFPIKFKK